MDIKETFQINQLQTATIILLSEITRTPNCSHQRHKAHIQRKAQIPYSEHLLEGPSMQIISQKECDLISVAGC